MYLERFVTVPTLTSPEGRIIDLEAAAFEVDATILTNILVSSLYGRFDPGPQYPAYQVGRVLGVG
jgi:hypothetical protein